MCCMKEIVMGWFLVKHFWGENIRAGTSEDKTRQLEFHRLDQIRSELLWWSHCFPAWGDDMRNIFELFKMFSFFLKHFFGVCTLEEDIVWYGQSELCYFHLSGWLLAAKYDIIWSASLEFRLRISRSSQKKFGLEQESEESHENWEEIFVSPSPIWFVDCKIWEKLSLFSVRRQ